MGSYYAKYYGIQKKVTLAAFVLVEKEKAYSVEIAKVGKTLL